MRYLNFVAGAILGSAGLGEARKPASYRYGELSTYEQSMISAFSSMPNLWAEPSRPSHKFRIRVIQEDEGVPMKLVVFKVPSKVKQMGSKHASAVPIPESYRYGQKYIKKHPRMRKSLPKSKPMMNDEKAKGKKCCCCHSYKYGKKWMKKPEMDRNKEMLTRDKVNRPDKREENQFIETLSFSATPSHAMKKPKLSSSQKKDLTKKMEDVRKRIDSIVKQLEEYKNKMNMDAGKGMNAKKMMDDAEDEDKGKGFFDQLEELLKESEAARVALAIFLGLAASALMFLLLSAFIKVMIKLTKEEEENRILLKDEVDRQHPISIVYKN